MTWKLSATLLALVSLSAFALQAADPAPGANAAEARLRETVRGLTTQLRAAQTTAAELQAAQTIAAEEKKALTERIAAMTKNAAGDKAAAEKTIAELTARSTEQAATIAELKDALQKTRADLQTSAEAARIGETQSEKLAVEKTVLERRVADREAKNLALFLVANEILARYEDFSLGNALAAKEPFIGVTRVKLENLLQDYQDKISDQRVKP